MLFHGTSICVTIACFLELHCYSSIGSSLHIRQSKSSVVADADNCSLLNIESPSPSVASGARAVCLEAEVQ